MQQQRLACHFELTSFKAQGGAALPKHFLEHRCMCVCMCLGACARACVCTRVCVHGPLITTWLPDQNPRELTAAHECLAAANHSIVTDKNKVPDKQVVHAHPFTADQPNLAFSSCFSLQHDLSSECNFGKCRMTRVTSWFPSEREG